MFRYRRQTHVTPKSYLSFLDGYKTIYQEKHEHIDEMAQRMNTGLDKLIEASASVDVLSKDLAVKEKELAVANKKADKVKLSLEILTITSLCLSILMRLLKSEEVTCMFLHNGRNHLCMPHF